MSPPGYQEGLRYITKRRFKMGLQELHCQLVEATPKPMSLKPYMWDIAPKMITGLMNIETEIYTVVRSGTSSIFSSSFDPKYTTSSRNLEKALTKHWGYSKTPKQGKGSHVKYQRQSAHGTSTIVLSGKRQDLPMKDLKDALSKGIMETDEAKMMMAEDPMRVGSDDVDPFLLEEYEKYRFDMLEQGLEPMSLEQFRREALAGMAKAKPEEEVEEIKERKVISLAGGGIPELLEG